MTQVVKEPMFFLISTLFTSSAVAFTPSPELFSSPALLVNYVDWSKRDDEFHASGTPSRALQDLVELLYDRDVGRPWESAYFPEVNRRLDAFRLAACKGKFSAAACFRPTIVFGDEDLGVLAKNLLDASTLELIGQSFGVRALVWNIPLREPAFSIAAGPVAEEAYVDARYWDLRPQTITWIFLKQPLLGDATSYVSSWQPGAAPAIFVLDGKARAAMDDWHLRERSMEFAAKWKHVVGANREFVPHNPVIEDKELLFQKMFDESVADFAAAYAEQLKLVTGANLARFEKERAAGDFPEETYEAVAYRHLRGLALLQGSYLSVAADQRKNTSARQQALESLLTLARYTASPRVLALELATRMEPLTSEAFVIDEIADFSIAQVYVLEQLKALLGIEAYEGQALFPRLGKGLVTNDLFGDAYLDEYAPEVKALLAGRDFTSLGADEQVKILRAYLVQPNGKVRPSGLFRLAAAWIVGADGEELGALADRVHEVRKANFR
jgi:hypothetical protein